MNILMINRALYARSAGEGVMFTVAEELERQGHHISWFARDDEKNPMLPDSYVASMPRDDSRAQRKRRLTYDTSAREALRERLHQDTVDLALVWQPGSLTWAVLEALADAWIPTYVMLMDYGPLCLCRNMDRKGHRCTRCMNGSFLSGIIHRCVQDDRRASALAARQETLCRRRRIYDLPWGYISPSDYHREMMLKACFTTRPVLSLDLPVAIPPEGEVTGRPGGYFLYVGTMERRRGVATLLEAMRQAVTDMPLVMAGDGPDFRELRELAEEMGLLGKVRFLGRLQSVSLRQVIHDCHCLIVPSECEEIAPWPLLEAQALGKPALVSNLSVLPERVQDGENGRVFKAGDPVMLSQMMDELADISPEEYEKMSRCARETAVARYDLTSYARRLTELDRYGEETGQDMDDLPQDEAEGTV